MPKAHCDDHRTMTSGKETNWGPTRTSTSDPRKDGMVYGPRGLGSRSRHSSRRSHALPRRLGRPTIGRRRQVLCIQFQGLRGREIRKPSLNPNSQVQGAGEPRALKGARVVCAVRRVMIFLLQAGGTGEMFLGYWHTWRRKPKGTKHAREAMHVRKRCRTGHSYDPLPMSKAELPEFES
jgi:hypothetical protein